MQFQLVGLKRRENFLLVCALTIEAPQIVPNIKYGLSQIFCF